MDSLTGFGRHFGGMGRALSARNYRVYWYGHLFSSNGGWIFLISSQWLIFPLTESPIWLGAIGFAYLAPLFFLGPLAVQYLTVMDTAGQGLLPRVLA
jgi:hypothetical protein